MKFLRGITIYNHLKEKIKHIQVAYAESVKKCDSSYLYDYRTVDVETGENIYWTCTLKGDESIPQDGVGTIQEPLEYGCNRGYWQIYFSYLDHDYKLNKNNAMMNLCNEDHDSILSISIRNKGSKIRLDLEVTSGKAYFYAVKGTPIVRGVGIAVSNALDQELTEVCVLFAESSSSVSDIETDEDVSLKQLVEFGNTNIPVRDRINSVEKVKFGYKRHYWQVKFTYNETCYRLERDNAAFKLTAGDNGEKLTMSVSFSKKSCRNDVICVEFKLGSRTKVFECKSVRTTEEREIEISNLSNYLDTHNVAARCSNRQSLIGYLRKIADELDDKYGSTHDRGSRTTCKLNINTNGLFYELPLAMDKEITISRQDNESNASSDGLLGGRLVDEDEDFLSDDEQIINSESFVKESTVNEHGDSLTVPEDLVNNVYIISLLKVIKKRFDKEKELIKKLRKVLEQVQYLYNETKRPYNPHLLGYGVAIEHLDFLGANSKPGLTVKVGNIKRGLYPDKLADVLEEEINLLNDDENPYKLFSLCCHALRREIEKFRLIRGDVIDSLRKVAGEFQNQTRNVSVSKLTASSASIVGGGLIVAGVVLEPFTFGASTGLIIAGVTMSVISGATAIGTNVCDTVLKQKALRKLAVSMKQDNSLRRTLSNLEYLLELISNDIIQNLNILQSKGNAHCVLCPTGSLPVKSSAQMFKSTVLKCGADIVGMTVDQCVNLARGSRSELGYRLEMEADKLEAELKLVETRIEQVISVYHDNEALHNFTNQLYLTETLERFISMSTEENGDFEGKVHTIFKDASTCCICMELFKDPRVLPCGHTFCLHCLISANQPPINVMPCPSCRLEVKIPSGNCRLLSKNYAVHDLMNKMAASVPSVGALSKAQARIVFPEVKTISSPLITSRKCPEYEMRLKRRIKVETGQKITGVTMFQGKICLICENSNKIYSFDKETFKQQPEKKIPGMRSPTDIASFNQAYCLFVVDSHSDNKCVWKLDALSNNEPVKWLDVGEESFSISITPAGELIQMECCSCWVLNLYKVHESKGKLERAIKLSREIKEPLHVVKTSNYFVVCYGAGEVKESGQWPEWKVSQVSMDGSIVRTLTSIVLSGPLYYMAADDDGGVFVSEGGTDTLLRLDSKLSTVQTLAKSPESNRPWKICHSITDGMLIIRQVTKYIDVYVKS